MAGTRATTRTIRNIAWPSVMYEDRSIAGQHIVRVEVGDGEVEAVVGLGEGVDGGDVDESRRCGLEMVAGV